MNNGALTLRSNNSNTGIGAIDINNAIATNGGDITMGGGSGAITPGLGYAFGQGTLLYGVDINANVSAGGASSGGNIIINGQGLNTASAFSGGINIDVGNLSTTFGGTITLNGIGGSGSGTQSRGVRVVANSVSAVNGDITINGTGGGSGASSNNHGVFLSNTGAAVTSTGTGNILITGTGGAGSGGLNHGVFVTGGTASINTSAASTGNITLTGTAGAGTSSGINITNANGVRTAGTSGNITMNADSFLLNTANNVNSVGTITVAPRTPGATMAVGTTGSVLNFSNADIGFLNAATGYIFGSTGAGNLTVNTTTNFVDRNVSFLSGGNITVAGNLAKTSGAGTVNYLLQAIGNVILNAAISATSGQAALNLEAGGNVSGSAGGTIATNGGLLTVNAGSGSGTLAGVISGTGAFTKLGAGTTVLSGANTYTGATTVSTSTLRAGSTSAFGSNSAVTVASGATLDLFGNNNSIGSLAGAGTVTNGSATAATLTNGNDNTSTTFSGLIQNGAGTTLLTKTGTGNLTLSGANTFTGGVTIQNGGALTITNSTALGTGTKTVTITNNVANQLRLQNNITLGSNINFQTSGPGNTTGGVIANESGNNTIDGTISMVTGAGSTSILSTAGTLTLNGNITASTTGRILYLNGAGDGVINGIISDGSTVNLPVRKSGAGTWTLTGANTYTGTTTVNAGTLNINGSWDVGAGTATTSVLSGATLAGSGVITAANLSHSGLGNLSLSGNNLVGTLSGTGTLGTIDFNNAQSLATSALTGAGFNIRTTGAAADLTLGGNISASAASGDSIILAAGRDLVNSGNRTLTTAGTARWQIYSGDAANATQTTGGLSGYNRYGCTYNAGLPSCAGGTNIPATGNGFYYAFAPSLTITGLTANNKVYDALTTASLAGTPAFSGLINGDSLSVDTSGATANFVDKNVGTAKSVTVGGYAATSNWGYLITQPSGLTANITKANVTVTADNTSKNQGAANPALTATLTGFVGGEVLGTSGITGSAGLSTTANSSSDIGTYVITSALGSLAASNYNFATFVNGLLTVNAVASTPRRLNPARIFPIRSYA